MDGTFLRDDKSYDEEKFTRIYQKLEKKDIKFTIASGNQYYQIATFFKDFPNVIYVAENGMALGLPQLRIFCVLDVGLSAEPLRQVGSRLGLGDTPRRGDPDRQRRDPGGAAVAARPDRA